MQNFKATLSAIALATTAISAPAQAEVLVENGDWQVFTFSDTGSAWDREFTFVAANPVDLWVTDAFQSGDMFEVFSNGASLGLTSPPTVFYVQINDDYDAAFASPIWSSRSFALGPGSYTISGMVDFSPFDSGSAAIRLLTARAPVPEPATWGLMLLGFAALGYSMRSRKAAVRVRYA